MNSKAFVFSLCFLLTPSLALAQQFNFKTATCGDFVALSDDDVDVATTWLDGHLSDEDDPESMVVDLSESDADEIKAYCQKKPGANLIQAVESMDPDSD